MISDTVYILFSCLISSFAVLGIIASGVYEKHLASKMRLKFECFSHNKGHEFVPYRRFGRPRGRVICLRCGYVYRFSKTR